MSSRNENTCSIWGTGAIRYPTPFGSGPDPYVHEKSPRAGGYYNTSDSLMESAKLKLKDLDVRRRLSYWIWKENMKKGITADTPHKDWPTIDIEILDKVEQWPIPSIEERVESVALQLYNCTNGKVGKDFGQAVVGAGGEAHFNGYEEVLSMQAASYCIDDREFVDLLTSMAGESGLLEFSPSGEVIIKLTLEGHRVAEAARRKFSL